MPIKKRAKKVCASLAAKGKLRTTRTACEHAISYNLEEYGQVQTPKKAKKRRNKR